MAGGAPAFRAVDGGGDYSACDGATAPEIVGIASG